MNKIIPIPAKTASLLAAAFDGKMRQHPIRPERRSVLLKANRPWAAWMEAGPDGLKDLDAHLRQKNAGKSRLQRVGSDRSRG